MLAIESARALLEHGASGLALLDLPAALVKGTSAIIALRVDFPDVTIMAEGCDVTDVEAMKVVTQKVRDELGSLNILCCFAGMAKCVSSVDMTIDEWHRVVDVNLTGCCVSAQAAGKYVLSQPFLL
jgi:NAD(P)-dependent dehydrogenase (short-subunit alcohol dehydrogenase family)